jgi:hypothetical protein
MKLMTLISLLTLSGLAFAMEKEKDDKSLPSPSYDRDVEIHGQDTADYFRDCANDDRQDMADNSASDDRVQEVHDTHDAQADQDSHDAYKASGKTY